MAGNDNRGSLDALNKLVGEMFQEYQYDHAPAKDRFPKGLRYHYWGRFWLASGVWAFCYSTTRNENGKFISWVYQPIVAKKSWKAAKQLEHRKAKDAKARALRMFKAHWPVQEKYEKLYKARQRKKGGKK